MVNLFESERLRLRAATAQDFPIFHVWWSNPEVAYYQINGAIRLNQEETNVRMFERWFSDGEAGVGFAVVLKETGELIGCCNLWGADIKNRSAHLGIIIAKTHWSRGFGTETVKLLLHYAFSELNYHRVQLEVSAFNERGIRAYTKAGFREVGRLREVIFRNGKWHDEVIMDVLQQEYLHLRA